MKIINALLLFISLCIQPTRGQGTEEQILKLNRQKLSQQDSATYSFLKQQMARYINPKPDSSLHFINELRKFTQKKKYAIGLVETDYLMANYFKRIQQYDSVVVYFEKSLQKSKKINYQKGIAVSYNGICRVKYLQGKNDEAITACLKCADIAKNLPDPSTLADTYIAIGNTYVRKNVLNKALQYYLKVDSLHTVKPLRPIIIAAAYQSIGNVYLQLKEYDKSEEYFLKANTQFKKISQGATFFLNTTNWHLGEVYFYKKQLKKSDSLLQKSYVFFNDIKDNLTLAQISIYLGRIKIEQNQLKEAEKYLLQGYIMLKNKKNLYEASQAAIELGKLYLKQNQINKAILYLKKALQTDTIENNSLILQKSYNSLSKAYAKINDYKNAYRYLKMTSQLKDSLNEIQNAAKIRELETIYQTEKKEKEIVLLTSKNKIIEQEKVNQRNIYLATIGFITLLTVFLFILYKNRQKTAKKLEELDKAKSDFFSGISHEFRTPLTLLLGPLQKKINNTNLTPQEREEFEMMYRNSNRLLSLVNQLLDISKIEAGGYKLQVKKDNAFTFINTLIEGFSYLAKQKDIRFNVNIKYSDKPVFFDKDVLEKIVTNLLSNAVKYTPKKGTISCTVFQKDNFLYFEIKNSGNAFNKETLSKIFEKFYQIDPSKEGVGIGLALVKQLVTLHKGTVTAENLPGGTIVFKVILPVNKESFSKQEIVSTKTDTELDKTLFVHSNKDSEEDLSIIETEIENTSKPILLLVDDNADVRTYLSNLFSEFYSIITAKDGKKGIQKAFKHIPDIIICDVMMPVLNGIELCKTLKNDERTSHIPIILLTAKAGEENTIEGITTGADDYITKPFREKILKAKVENLLNNRKKLQSRYRQDIILKPKDIAITSVDEDFLNRVQKVLEEKLIEPTFNVNEFSEAIGMSRMQLHRKLKALTGLTASEFIKSQRLKLAANLLKQSDINISEVGYSVGFNNHAYFSKCFKEAYKVTPSEYANATSKTS